MKFEKGDVYYNRFVNVSIMITEELEKEVMAVTLSGPNMGKSTKFWKSTLNNWPNWKLIKGYRCYSNSDIES